MRNIPEVKLGIVAVSRDCFPSELSTSRRTAVVKACRDHKVDVVEVKTVVENETDVLNALKEISDAKINALVIYLGNFGPEGPETLLAQKFSGPVMYVAAAEETQSNLIDGRGDAYCGLLNASYNLGLRNLNAYIPERPVGTPTEIAPLVADFMNIARVVVGVRNLKVFSFGPRPENFLACNAPIKPLYNLGVEIMENSELDLLLAFKDHENDSRIPSLVKEMEEELAVGNNHPDLLPKLAQYELTLLDWMEENLGASKYAAFANKCWPAFSNAFGFVPCYVNSRLTAQGFPVACEVDIYGALSEYIIACAGLQAPTLLDINNTVPQDMYEDNKELFADYKLNDLFMGFHCGNTPSCHLQDAALKYQLIMHRTLEPDSEPNITRGTLEGNLKPGDVTIFRLHGTADSILQSYVAQGEIINVDPKSFGGIGVIAVPEMARFYRHVLIGKRYPHHTGVAFKHIGKVLFAAMSMLGVKGVAFNQPATMLYPGENPFS